MLKTRKYVQIIHASLCLCALYSNPNSKTGRAATHDHIVDKKEEVTGVTRTGFYIDHLPADDDIVASLSINSLF